MFRLEFGGKVTDGTTSSFTQSLSDWGSPQNYAGESIALTMPYRLTSTGAQQSGPWYLYAYSLPLNSSKTVKSLTLPNVRNVVVLAITLATSPSTVSLGSAANVWGISNNGSAVINGGLDTASYAYSANLLGSNLTFSAISYSLGGRSGRRDFVDHAGAAGRKLQDSELSRHRQLWQSGSAVIRCDLHRWHHVHVHAKPE